MLLREMTDPAFAHSFKRFARLAVAGLALAGLAACGGGPGPVVPDLSVTQKPAYTSLAFNVSTRDAEFRANDTLAEARSRALAACGDGCQEFMWFRNACGSVARSGDNNFHGAGWAASENDAEKNAVAACRAAGGQSCRTSTSRGGDNFTVCNKRGSLSATGEAKPIPARRASPPDDSTPPGNSYGSFALVITGSRWGHFNSGEGNNESSARSAALAACGSDCERSHVVPKCLWGSCH